MELNRFASVLLGVGLAAVPTFLFADIEGNTTGRRRTTSPKRITSLR
jgi:hypothetical protein